MSLSRLLTLVVVAGVAVPRLGEAQDSGQRKPIELGLDAALARESGDDFSSTSFTLPVTRLRAGFFLSDKVSLEPSLSFSYASTTNENPITGDEFTNSGMSYDLIVSMLYHFRADRTQSQPYLRPFVGLRGFNSDSDRDEFDGSGTQTSFGAAFGFKFPVSGRVGTRVEAGYTHHAENEPEFRGTNVIFLGVGLSFFTR